MKKILLFLTLLCTTALGVMAQCDVPTNVQANADHNLVNLSWESSLLDPVVFSDSITYGNTATSGIGTGSAFTFTVAVRFPASMLAGVNGQYLSHVNFVPWQLNVSAVTIKVWTGGSYNTTYNEGTLVSTTNVNITELTAEANNTVRLSTPVQVNTSQGELWIGIEYVATGGYPAGCGSALTAGFNNLIYSNGEWAELTDLNEDLLYGWCIAGLFTSSLPEITGFNVFRDNVQLNTTPVTGHNYTDASILGETQYCYTVQSICSGTTSIPSDPACITTPYQPTCYPIGNGTGTCYTHPFNTYYNYSYTQQIYKATEIGAQSGNIVALTFDYFYTSPITMNDITVYMANVNRETFASSSDWLPGSELTQVFHGSVYCSNAYSNKVTINFDDIFEWDGHSNILVAIVNSQGSYENSNPRFYTHTTSGNTVLHAYNDDNTYNILHGNTPGYNIGSISVVSAEKLFTIGTTAEVEISFDVQIGGEDMFDFLKVFFAPADETYPASTSLTTTSYADETYNTYAVNFTDYLQYSEYTSLPYKFNLTNGNTVHVTVAMPNPNANPDANSTAKLVFLWRNDHTGGAQPAAIVRNVSIAPLACPAPTNLSVMNITGSSADISWNATGNEENWILEYRASGDSTWTSVPVSGTPAYSLSDLTVGIPYQRMVPY